MPGYQQTLIVSQIDGTAVTATDEGSLLPAVAKFVIPANTINVIGKKYVIRAHGRISNIVTNPGTLTLKVKMGPTSTIAAATSSAISLNVVAKTNVAWFLDISMIVRAVGSGTTATLFTQGQWTSESVVGSAVPTAGGAGTAQWQAATPAVGTGFDTSVDNIVDLTATFSLTGNSIQCHGFALIDETFTP
jgi:hypothetical protein